MSISSDQTKRLLYSYWLETSLSPPYDYTPLKIGLLLLSFGKFQPLLPRCILAKSLICSDVGSQAVETSWEAFLAGDIVI